MNKKGFTLVELIATILILGLVVGIAFTSINSFSNSFRNKQFENIIKKIENAASNYAFDSGKEIVFVQELIDQGYYGTSDSEKVVNPINNERLNCYVVEMRKNGSTYDAKFNKNNKYELSNGDCDNSKIQNNDSAITITSSGIKSNSNGWISTNNFKLKATSSSLSINCNTNKCIWTSSSGLNKEGNVEITIGNPSLLNTTYTFQYIVINNSSVKRYTKNINVKIDNEKPQIYKNEFIIYDTDNDNKKNLEISASDGNGSGISGYYIGGNCTSATYNSNNIKEINPNGSYTICVKDKVGNINSVNINVINGVIQ